MNKKFEYIDDNPGSYFGMLVENWENLNEDEKNLRNWIEKKVGKQMSNMKPIKIGYRHGRPYYSVDFVDGTSDDYFIDFDKKEIEKCESLKKDKLKESSNNKLYRLDDIHIEFYFDEDDYDWDEDEESGAADYYGYDPEEEAAEDTVKKWFPSAKYIDIVDTDDGDGFLVADIEGPIQIFNEYNELIMDDIETAIRDFIKCNDLSLDEFKKIAINSGILDNDDFDGISIEESLKEDKFVPQDKMSKKAQKELNDKKRRTWGNTKPVTRVKPNNKAYDRKRDSKVVDERLDKQSDFELTYILDELKDLSKYYRTRQDGWSKKDSQEFLVDISNLLHRMQHLFRKAEIIDESKELNESSDGWDEGKLSDLSYILDKLANLQYEINNCVKGAYSHCTSYSELGEYIKDLGSELMDIADDVSEYVEEDDEEDED